MHTDVTPSLDDVAGAPKGVRLVALGVRKLAKWRAFFNMHSDVPSLTQPKLLTHSGHSSVLILHSNILPGRAVSSSASRATIRMIT